MEFLRWLGANWPRIFHLQFESFIDRSLIRSKVFRKKELAWSNFDLTSFFTPSKFEAEIAKNDAVDGTLRDQNGDFEKSFCGPLRGQNGDFPKFSTP